MPKQSFTTRVLHWQNEGWRLLTVYLAVWGFFFPHQVGKQNCPQAWNFLEGFLIKLLCQSLLLDVQRCIIRLVMFLKPQTVKLFQDWLIFYDKFKISLPNNTLYRE